MWITVFSVFLGCAAFLPVAQAWEDRQQTKVTFSQPVEIPGQVLPAGTYWFVVTGDTFNGDFVRIYGADRTTVIATELTVATERSKPADGILLTFAERQSSEPEALLKWFYPGETVGHEFQYRKPEEEELAQDKQRVVEASSMNTQSRAGL
jgi:hypothetical protein